VDQKIEVIVIAVSDVDRARDFYVRCGWRLDATPPGVVQLTPPGSACSVQFGPLVSTTEPGSGKGYVVVSDLEAARNQLLDAGVEVGEMFHLGPNGLEKGLDPDRGTYRSRAELHDPDGNTWILQEITTRLPGRVDADEATYSSVTDLADAMRRASAAHGEHEKRIGQADENWPDWYAEFMVRERTGQELPV
jgi:catechol 2,3-dioxygenase-like lactoylglutathione lyase family enzyme